MEIIILDGWYKGKVIHWNTSLPEIRLLKPPVITFCDCNPDVVLEDNGPSVPEEITYKMAFRSIDGKVALYSLKGESISVPR